MAITSFSIKYDRELDATQYLSLLGYDLDKDPELRHVSKEMRDFIHQDLMCPSCGVRGAILVSGSQNKIKSKNTKQPHFRYIDYYNEDTHDELCDFRESKPFKDISVETISFTKSKSENTKLIAEYVSKALHYKLFNRADIANFRVWHLNKKKNNLVKLNIEPTKIPHYVSIFRCKFNEQELFHPALGDITYLDWKFYATERLVRKEKLLLDIVEKHKNHFRNFSEISKYMKNGDYIFDVRILDEKYILIKKLSRFFTLNFKEIFKSKYEISFLDAFLGLIGYVNNWDYNMSKIMIAKIASLPNGDYDNTDNIISLNPFKDYEVIKTVLNMNDVSDKLWNEITFNSEVDNEIAKMKNEYKSWKENE